MAPPFSSEERAAQNAMAYDADPSSTSNVNLTFISIHDLTPEARVLYSSDSIVDVLGYTPDQVVNRSCWDFFPIDELPFAQQYLEKGIAMDRAAVLNYCKIQNNRGQYIGCECCFTIVYDVMIVCTSVYRGGMSSQKRAVEAPIIRRLFSASPRDPRYHMLSHISHKFQQNPKLDLHEPRAALFLNRFTRTLTIMYATSAIEEIIGISSDVLRGQSFYYCIAENCLQDAIKCLETAKGNDSIAYLRFWFRDPRTEQDFQENSTADDSDEEMTTESSVDQEMGGGVALDDLKNDSDGSTHSSAIRSSGSMDVDEHDPNSRTSSHDSTNPADTHEAIFGTTRAAESSSSSLPLSPERSRSRNNQGRRRDPVELEAVISCASDGLVVCLRRARPMIPQATARPSRPVYQNGLFAAPWAEDPLLPSLDTRAQFGYTSRFAPSLGPRNAQRDKVRTGGPEHQDFMTSIREQAIFAWALTSINGSLQRFGIGTPTGEALPANGLPIWQSDTAVKNGEIREGRTDSASSCIAGAGKWSPSSKQNPADAFGDPGLGHASRRLADNKGHDDRHWYQNREPIG